MAGYLMDFGFGGFIGYGKGVSVGLVMEELANKYNYNLNDMENISTVIKALFEKVDGDEVLKKAGFGKEKDEDPCRMDSDMIESVIVNKLLQVDKESTIDQVSMLEQIVQFKGM